MCNSLVVCWQSPETRGWHPIGWLSFENGLYSFRYTKAAKLFENSRFLPLGITEKLDGVYRSETLFPVFKNRLLTKSRPEYSDYLKWLGFEGQEVSDMDELSRSGGIRATDNLQLFPMPKRTSENSYKVQFFAHGTSHFTNSSKDCVYKLLSGQSLFLMKDVQNSFDSLALMLRTDNPPEFVGYCPSFLVNDFSSLIEKCGAHNVNVSVRKVNSDSPLQYSLLCEIQSPWPNDFKPFNGDEFQPITAKYLKSSSTFPDLLYSAF